MKEFWIMFFKDPTTGSIHGTAIGHNCIGDYKGNPYFIGSVKVDVDLNNLYKE